MYLAQLGGGAGGLVSWFKQFLSDLTLWFAQLLEDFGLWMRDLMAAAWDEMTSLLVVIIPDGVEDSFTDLGDAWLIPSYEIVAYAFPLGGLFAIWLTTVSTVGGIRLARWLLALIPRPITGLD